MIADEYNLYIYWLIYPENSRKAVALELVLNVAQEIAEIVRIPGDFPAIVAVPAREVTHGKTLPGRHRSAPAATLRPYQAHDYLALELSLEGSADPYIDELHDKLVAKWSQSEFYRGAVETTISTHEPGTPYRSLAVGPNEHLYGVKFDHKTSVPVLRWQLVTQQSAEEFQRLERLHSIFWLKMQSLRHSWQEDRHRAHEQMTQLEALLVQLVQVGDVAVLEGSIQVAKRLQDCQREYVNLEKARHSFDLALLNWLEFIESALVFKTLSQEGESELVDEPKRWAKQVEADLRYSKVQLDLLTNMMTPFNSVVQSVTARRTYYSNYLFAFFGMVGLCSLLWDKVPGFSTSFHTNQVLHWLSEILFPRLCALVTLCILGILVFKLARQKSQRP